MTTPPLISVIGTLVKRFRRARHFIWEMDLYPDIAVDVGVIRPNSLLARSIGTIADAQRRAADGVIAVGECMRDRLVARGIIGDHIHVVENWADGRVFYPRPGVPKAHVSIVYTGNFGLGHEEETLLGALPVLERDSRFRFAFIGGGSRHAHLKAWCCSRGFQNVVFKSYCTIAELTGTELAQSRIGLVLQASQCSGSIVPSKLYSMLASGLPVLFIGPESATPARIVKRFGCGWHVECGDVDGFTQLLQKLAECTSLIDDAGIRARQIFLERYDLEIGVGKLFSILGLEHNAARGHTSPERARAAPLSR